MSGRKLIYDVGMHKGEDTEFYLSRGHNVVGIEANPQLLSLLYDKFAPQIKSGRLIIVGKAVAPKRSTVKFATFGSSTGWGSVSDEFEARNIAAGRDVKYIDVDSVPFRDILKEYGLPHYLKIDVEGMDMHCVETLVEFDKKPTFISIESSVSSTVATVEGAFSELAQLWNLGYRRFKYVDQAGLARLNGRMLELEGDPICYEHRPDSSGPFGEEAPGDWQSIDKAWQHAKNIMRVHNAIGFGGPNSNRLWAKVARRLRRYAKRLPYNSWYDLHARLN